MSVDPAESHREWEGDIADVTGHTVNFPVIADPDRAVATPYDMIHPNASDTMTVRSVFVISPDNKVKLSLTYPASTGRIFEEVVRVLDSLQLTASHSVATPADWKHFPQGFVARKPYLRVTPQPNVGATETTDA